MVFREKLTTMIKNNENKALDDLQLLAFSESFVENIRQMDSMKLYRFMPFNYNNLRSIEKNNLYLSEIGKMNDVFEGLTLAHPSQEINFKDLYDLVYLKSFSEKKESLLMWSHYGDNHKGLCVEYDLKHLTNQVGGQNTNHDILWHLFPVVYLENRIDDKSAFEKLKYASKSIEDYKHDLKNKNFHDDNIWHEDIKSLFLMKSEEWEYEKEWRIAVTFSQINECADEIDDKKALLYNVNGRIVDFDCITSIYCGANLESDKIDHVKEIVSRLNNEKDYKISVFKNILKSDEYKLDARKIL